MTIAQLIAQARRNAGMTQQQLADTMGASRSLIAQWESGAKRELQWETICRIANATNQSTEYFREGNKMKTYHVNPEFVDQFGDALSANGIVTQEQITQMLEYYPESEREEMKKLIYSMVTEA